MLERINPLPEEPALVGGAGSGGSGGDGAGAGATGGGSPGAGGEDTGTGGQGASGAGCDAGWPGDVQLGTAQSDELLAIAVDAEGHLIVAGYEAGILGVANVEPVGNARGVVSKYSPQGSLIWRHVVDTPSAEIAHDIALDASGRIHVIGRTNGALGGFTNQGQFDLFAQTLDASGAVLQTLQWGNERPQQPRKMALDAKGALVIAGFDDIYVPTNYVEDWEDAFVMRLAPEPDGASALSVEWWYQYQTEGKDYLLGAAVDAEGSIFVSGFHFTEGDRGAIVRKLHPDGSADWVQHISPSFFDLTYSVAVSPSGELYAAGATHLTLGAKSFGQHDVFVAKLDRNTGEILWTTQAGWSSSDMPTALTFDARGNIYVAGASWDGEDNDLFAMKLSPAGELVSTWQHGTPANDEVRGAAVDGCGRLVVVGYTEGSLVTGTPNAGARDAFLLRADLRASPGAAPSRGSR